MDAARNTVIKEDCSEEEWRDLEQHVEMLEPEDLAAIAERLGCSQASDWHDYLNEFREYTWSDFVEAYEHCTYRKYYQG